MVNGDAGRAAIVEYWRKIEMLSPNGIPKVRPRDWSYRLEPDEPLPWDDRHALRRVRLNPHQTWRYQVYCGVYRLKDMYRKLEELCGAEDDGFGEQAKESSAVMAFELNADGIRVQGSQLLSTAAWGVGRALSLNGAPTGWLDGFSDWESMFGVLFEEAAFHGWDVSDLLLNAARKLGADNGVIELLQPLLDLALKASGADVITEIFELLNTPWTGDDGERETEPVPMTHESLREAAAATINWLNLDSHLDPARAEIRVKAVRIPKRLADEPGELDLLNSFIAEDLGRIVGEVQKGRLGSALRRYLSDDPGSRDRIDVRQDVPFVQDMVAPTRVPAGRWPDKAERAMALNQQLAVNDVMNRLSGTKGVLSVNGPPGTGKTTQLRDVIAALVTERARRLSRLKKPADAFNGTVSYRLDGGKEVSIPRLIDELTGFEITVSAATNAAVENITKQIPGIDAIDRQWAGESDYFADVATTILNYSRAEGFDEDGKPAWSLIAARLGNMANRKEFATAFWWGVDERKDRAGNVTRPRRPGMQELLTNWRTGPRDRTWADAVARFRDCEAEVDRLRAQRDGWRRLDETIVEYTANLESLRERCLRLNARVAECEQSLAASNDRNDHVRKLHADARESRSEHHGLRPGFVEALFTLGKAVRQWRVVADEHAEKVEAAGRVVAEAEREMAARTADLATEQQDHRRVVGEIDRLEAELAGLRSRRERLGKQVGEAFPDAEFWRNRELRERRAPWLDEAFNAARTRLFLAALALHRDFLQHQSNQMLQALRTAVDCVQGGGPGEPEVVLAAWRALYLVVPVVSTTFASLPRLFKNVEREGLGWFVIDEAGQATPQGAVGGLWRHRRFVAVGDPLQLEPVVTLPIRTQQIVREQDGVSDRWLPGATSVQRLVDAQARLGTTLTDPDGEDLWVGVPLSVHRRCDEPMFGIVNRIAYGGTMLRGVSGNTRFALPDGDIEYPASEWRHVAGTSSQGHWIPDEGTALAGMLAKMKARGQDFSKVFVLSPFRDVVSRLSGFQKDFDGLHTGTIHTAQGKETDIVILVLGSDPKSDGARQWASGKPNLLNVAVSRAKRRLYVIGNRELWRPWPYFKTLSSELKVRNVPPIAD